MKKPIATTVNIGTLKNKLSAYLRKVKLGDEVIITEHKQPMAKIIPLDSRSDELKIIPAKSNLSYLIKLSEAPSSKTDYNSLEGLKRDREER